MVTISVIIPIYNAQAYIEKCLDSVLQQGLLNIEIICVDDGSTDRSADIVKAYINKHSNIKLFQKENGGPSSARNAGIDLAVGEYILFLDSDDYIAADALETLYHKAVSESLDILYFNAVPFYEDESSRENEKQFDTYYTRPQDYSGICSGQEMFRKMRTDRKFLASAALQLFRKDFLIHNSIRFYFGIVHEDNLFSFQCAMKAQRVNYIPNDFYFRRVHPNSIMTSRKTMRNVEGYLVCYCESLAFLRNCKVEESTEPLVAEYLYNHIFRNAVTISKSLNTADQNALTVYGGAHIKHLVQLAQHQAELELERDALKNTLSTARTEYHQKIQDLHKEKSERWQELQSLYKEKDERWRELQALRKEKDERWQELQALRKEKDERWQELQTLHKEVNKLNSSLLAQEKENETLRQENQTLSNNLNFLETETIRIKLPSSIVRLLKRIKNCLYKNK